MYICTFSPPFYYYVLLLYYQNRWRVCCSCTELNMKTVLNNKWNIIQSNICARLEMGEQWLFLEFAKQFSWALFIDMLADQTVRRMIPQYRDLCPLSLMMPRGRSQNLGFASCEYWTFLVCPFTLTQIQRIVYSVHLSLNSVWFQFPPTLHANKTGNNESTRYAMLIRTHWWNKSISIASKINRMLYDAIIWWSSWQ